MNSGVYQIRNLVNGKVYIGSTYDFEQRKFEHFKALKELKHHSILLQRAFNLYSEENFVFEVLEIVLNEFNLTKKDFGRKLAEDREQFYLNKHFAQEFIKKENKKFRELTYNIKPSAISSLGKECTKKTRKRQSVAQLGKTISSEIREKISSGLRKYNQEKGSHNAGRIRRPDQIRKLSIEEIQRRQNTRIKNGNGYDKMTMRRRPVVQIDFKSGSIINEFLSIKEATEKTGILNISAVCRGKFQSAKGFKFKYKEDIN